MSQCTRNLNDIYTLTKLFSCNEIKLFAWGRNHNSEVLVLYTSNGDFVYHNLDIENPVIKQFPWFKSSLHAPVSIDFSPSGCFLLVLSESCHLFILPICSAFASALSVDLTFNASDLTIHAYPFNSKGTKQNKLKTKSFNLNSNASFDLISQSVLTPTLNNVQNSNPDSSQTSNSFLNENETKLKEISCMKHNVFPSAVCWWQPAAGSQEVCVIGTKSGHIIFVDLIGGIKIGETSVKGKIKDLSVCQDTCNDNAFLLITVDNNGQYKLSLEQNQLINNIWPGKQSSSSNEDVESEEVQQSVLGNWNSHSTRTRLQGLKQMSAGKLTSIKHKIAETRSKMSVKQGLSEKSSTKIPGASPENLGSILGETFLSRQIYHDENVLAGYYAHSQLLTVHSMNLEVVPRMVHKMPVETEKVLLCDRVIFVISGGRKSLQVVSSKLTETQIEEKNEFNSDSVLGKWSLNDADDEEIILDIRKTVSKLDHLDLSQIYKLEKSKEELPEFPQVESCAVVTNKNVYVIHPESNIVKIVLDLILETHELEKAERFCTIFGIDLQKLLELAGDIKLSSSEFPTAIALYKLSKCGLLKSIVKLACGSHCSQVLNYSLMLMSNSISEMSLTEKIHLSNLILMAYTQQILKNENNRKLLEKFTEFLETNSYYDEVLGVSVTGQSLLFACLRKLITHKGLIMDGYEVLIKLMERFASSKTLDWNVNQKEFWECATEIDLIEAVIVKLWSFPTYLNYVSRHLEELDALFLDRLLTMLDPTAFCLRPLARLFENSCDSLIGDESQSIFPFEKLVELFLLTLLVKLYKKRNEEENYERDFLLVLRRRRSSICGGFPALRQDESFDSAEALCDENFWPPRKNSKGLSNENFKNRPDSVLSCGYGHTALIRNGSVYTWGQTAKGCLGQGPTMSRYASPSPISSLNSFKLEVFLVACGKNHTAILTDNGVYTWGCSSYGQLGLGEIRESPYPRLVNALANETVVALSCGQFHTLALTSQGSVFAWGWGVHGQLGLGSVDDQRLPKHVESLKEHLIVDIAAGHGHSLVLSDKGHVYSFGSGVFGQLGTGTTAKYSSPVLVKGFSGRIVALATGYFHNLALTESNALYTWGSSPQCLRFQAQARKKSKLLQSPHSAPRTRDFESPKSPTVESIPRVSIEPSEEGRSFDSTQSELHLSPSLVDTSSVSGKIVQISCGCHHSALVTDSGGLYSWGRSPDGQLGIGGHREIRIPTQINENTFRVDHVSCGCEFTAAQEKRTGKIYAWGSNSVGQLAVPVKESATKSLDGKLVMLKSCKRIVRLLDRNAGSNSVNVPKEILEIPPPAFTYQPLSKRMPYNSENLSILDPGYSRRSFHFVVEKFSNCIDLNLILNKSLEYNNYQVASKISLLQNNYKQSIVYQLKALQNVPKYRANFPSGSEKQEPDSEDFESPEGKIRLFDVQVRPEKDGQKPRNDPERINNENALAEKDSFNSMAEDDSKELKIEYVDHARYIIDSYLNLNSDQAGGKKLENCSIIETGIQFWTAEKLSMSSLEKLFFDKLDEIFYDLGYLLFCQRKESRFSFVSQFSSSFLFAVTSKILNLIKNNGCFVEYLDVMSRILTREKFERKTGSSGKKRNPKREEVKMESSLEAIKENLKDPGMAEDHVKISFGDVSEEKIYFFSCGHFHSANGLKEEFGLFEDVNGEGLRSNLMDVYEELMRTGKSDLACPGCVRNRLRQ